MRRLLYFVTAMWVAVLVAAPQAKGQDTAAGVTARVVGKPLYLRGGWSTDALDFDANGTPKKTYEVVVPTLSGFEATAVELKGKTLVIEGQRFVVALGDERGPRRMTWHSKSYSGMVVLTIHGERHQDFGRALDAILTPDMDQVVHPAGPVEREDGEPPLHIGGEVTAPKMLYGGDVTLPKAANDLRYAGNVQVSLWVEADGKPSHVRVTHAVGVGIDEAAVTAMRKYLFQPATLRGKPVRVEMLMNVNVDLF